MADVHTPEVRARNMRAIRSKDTKPELLIRRGLHASGFRYRLGGCGLPGRPDLVLPKYKTVIFVHGCFWHGHSCKYFKLPATRTDFWAEKISVNQLRDARDTNRLLEMGWCVIIVWECGLKPLSSKLSPLLERISALLNDSVKVTGCIELF
ncbi:very short patch repair endonuclease [Pseudomonas sp. NPDC012596]|uniref:very short patch repair endonuclease n=1 Tax=Pseudomonas sp. NPDC012596 TaxID=3364419 RepID=UPI0036864F9B